MDEDLDTMSREALVAEIRRLRDGIRAHRDTDRHELCWHHPALWGLLPERTDPQPTVPVWPEFLRGCIRYRQSLDAELPGAPRTDEPYEEPEARTPGDCGSPVGLSGCRERAIRIAQISRGPSGPGSRRADAR